VWRKKIKKMKMNKICAKLRRDLRSFRKS
jgi:hypothetical protein